MVLFIKRLRCILPDLTTTIGKETFQNPIFVASGTFGYGLENNDLVDVSKLGAIITKSITRHPREGNPPPRIVETPSGMINSIGLANIGVEQYIEEMIPKYEGIGVPIIMNIAGSSEEEYCEILEMMETISSNIVGYEINISCPNVKVGGIEFGVDPGVTETLTSALRNRTEKLLIMKLSPNVTDIRQIARAAENGGADAVSAINTVYGMSINAQSRKTNIHTIYGGLSGPAIKPIGLACVHKISTAVKIPIIGIGGITNAEDAIEYMLAGASSVQIGTANFRNPAAGISIIKAIESYCHKANISHISDLIGKVAINE
jgi:dihydroorotate dehydrogenase (NAD+) catalytic subunit